MKFHLCVLFTLAVVPTIFAEGPKPLSLWELIRDKVGHGVGPFPHIGGGAEAPPHAYPHQVMLNISPRPGVGAFCGGSLISPDWVLTAAHCVNHVESVDVVLGVHNRDANEDNSRQYIKASEIHVEPNYDSQDTDIALLKLEKPATLNQFVQPIRLPALSMKGKDLAGTPAEITGWGRYTDPDSGLSPVLRFAHTKVMGNKDCQNKGWGDRIKDWRICTDGSDNKGPCGGDSGGPMFITEQDGKRTVIGIVSFGDGAGCVNDFPNVLTRVDAWLEWINRLTHIPLRN